MNVIRFEDLVARGQAQGKRVFIRADLNVPLGEQGAISDDTRIRASLPAMRLALEEALEIALVQEKDQAAIQEKKEKAVA